MSLLQLGNRRNGPRTACRTPAFYASPTRGSASPEGPPESPSRKTRIALLQKRRSNHEPRRAATESPNSSVERGLDQRSRWRRPSSSAAPKGSRTDVAGPTRRSSSARLPHQPALSNGHPEGHLLSGANRLSLARISQTRRPTGHEQGLARDEPAPRSRSRPLPEGNGWNRLGSPSPQPRFRCRNRDRDESFDLEFTGLNQQPPSQTWIRRPLPEKSGSQSQPEHDLTPRPPSPPPEGDSNGNRTAESARSVRTRRHSEAFGPSTPKDRDAWSSEEPASPALGSRKPSSSRTCRRPGPKGSRRFELRRAVEPSARRISNRVHGAPPTRRPGSHQDTNRGSALSRLQRRDLDLQSLRRDPASFWPLLLRSQLELFIS